MITKNSNTWITPASPPFQFQDKNDYGVQFNKVSKLIDMDSFDSDKKGVYINASSGQNEIVDKLIEFKDIEHLKFDYLNMKKESFEKIIKSFPSLRSLDLGDSQPNYHHLISEFKKLESLVTCINWKMDNFEHFECLKDLEIIHIKTINDAFAKIIPKLPKLTELKLENIGRLTNKGLEDISKSSSVQSLYLHNGDDFDEAGSSHLSKLKQLKFFEIKRKNSWPAGTTERRFQFDDNNLAQLLDDCSLETLRIEFCKITKKGLQYLLNDNKLKKMVLLECCQSGPDQNIYYDFGSKEDIRELMDQLE